MTNQPITPGKLLAVRLVPHPRDNSIAALQLETDGGSVAFTVNRKTLEELADALRARAQKMPEPGPRTPGAGHQGDTFHFLEESE